MMFWNIAGMIVLGVSLVAYVFLFSAYCGGVVAALRGIAHDLDHPFPLSSIQKSNFERSMKRIAKSTHIAQGTLLILMTIVLAFYRVPILNALSMFTVLLAMFHFSWARRIVV